MAKDVRIILGSKTDSAKANVMIGIFKKLYISYKLSICSCHRNPLILPEFIRTVDENIIAYIGGHNFQAPAITRAFLTGHKLVGKIVIAVPVDRAGRSAYRDLPAGTPVFTCGLNTEVLDHGIINSALAIGHVLAIASPKTVGQALIEWYAEQGEKKRFVEEVGLDEKGLIPISISKEG